jgi:NTE family protein
MGKITVQLGLALTLAASCSAAAAGSAVPAPATSQTTTSQTTTSQVKTLPVAAGARPRVCLVLSGGGARGMAHIGVLKVLEQLKVPIDCIAGTSMGAVVGGLYASGMTAQQIDATMRSVDWQEAFRDAPPRRELAFRRKQDDQNFLVRLPLGVKHGKLLLPKGLIQGQKLQETLRQLTLPYSNTTDFNRLPTPFQAVATDLVTGNTVLIDKGDLAVAMRASISAPGVFAPVEYNGLLLVDGGLAENLPVDVARSMHPDILIVSDVSFQLQPRAALDSALSISNQMLAILVRKDTDRQRASLSAQDILVEPILGTATSTDFSAAEASIKAGEIAARAMLSRLDALTVSDSAYAEYLADRTAREPGRPEIQFVHVDEQSKRYEKTIVAEMQPLIGKPLDANTAGPRINELYGLGNFETLDYSLADRGQGDDEDAGYDVRARRKSWGPNYVRFGLNLEDDFQGNSRYNAAARFIMTELNTYGAELVTDVQIGNDQKLAAEFYQPLNAARTWFVAPSLRIEGKDFPVYSNDVEIADYRDREVEGDFDVGKTIGNWGEIRVGYHRINGAARDRLGDPSLIEPVYNEGELFFKFSYDRLDNVHFPRDGQAFSLQWDANRTDLGADTAYDKTQADWLMARSNGRNTILLWATTGATLDGNLNPNALPQFYSLGGFFNLSGLAPQSLIGPNFAIARAIYFRRISRGGEGFFEVPVYLGASLELGNIWQHRGDVSVGSARKDGSVFVAFDTFLGPLYLGTGYDTAGYSSFSLFLGRTF